MTRNIWPSNCTAATSYILYINTYIKSHVIYTHACMSTESISTTYIQIPLSFTRGYMNCRHIIDTDCINIKQQSTVENRVNSIYDIYVYNAACHATFYNIKRPSNVQEQKSEGTREGRRVGKQTRMKNAIQKLMPLA